VNGTERQSVEETGFAKLTIQANPNVVPAHATAVEPTKPSAYTPRSSSNFVGLYTNLWSSY